MDRVKTGIKGFDELVEGGFPKGFNVLLTGMPGTGKTIFGLQYLYNGAMKGEPGIYVSLDMPDDKVKDQALQFGWNTEELGKSGKLSILKIPLDREKIRIFDMIEEEVEKLKATRLVFDSLAAFAINIEQFTVPLAFDDEVTRVLGRTKSADGGLVYMGNSEKRITYLALNQLSKLGTTNVIITDQTPGGYNSVTLDGVSEYVCDGVVRVDVNRIAKEAVRSMTIHKMRNTNHTLDSLVFNISGRGISLQKRSVFEGSKVSGISPEG